MEARPAFYALAPGGWRDYVTLLHPPYTLWHLSYVVIGAALAPHFPVFRVALALAAFFLALGVGAHALDELKGRPLQTRIPSRTLVLLGAISLAGAMALGVGVALAWNLWLLPFVVFGGFVVCAYNLELFDGRFHNWVWFALAWGSFPVLVGYFTAAGRITVEALLAALFAALLSTAQQILSTPVRHVRRRVATVSGTVELKDGRREPIDSTTLMHAPDLALRVLSAATVTLAAALLVLRLA
jgi:heme O synthase-like polyprenyltransferase